jgi:hypothetical protein
VWGDAQGPSAAYREERDMKRPEVVYREQLRPCAICLTPEDALWHFRRGTTPPDPNAPGVCRWCAANACIAFAADKKGASSGDL